jgi:large subunit ribosomal protein L27
LTITIIICNYLPAKIFAFKTMAHKKAGGSSKNGRDSNANRRGIKAFGGQVVRAGAIIVRQCGTKFFPGLNTALGNDFTIFATKEGKVNYTEKRVKKFNSQVHRDIFVSVE